jgi:hypothetical protein
MSENVCQNWKFLSTGSILLFLADYPLTPAYRQAGFPSPRWGEGGGEGSIGQKNQQENQ